MPAARAVLKRIDAATTMIGEMIAEVSKDIFVVDPTGDSLSGARRRRRRSACGSDVYGRRQRSRRLLATAACNLLGGCLQRRQRSRCKPPSFTLRRV